MLITLHSTTRHGNTIPFHEKSIHRLRLMRSTCSSNPRPPTANKQTHRRNAAYMYTCWYRYHLNNIYIYIYIRETYILVYTHIYIYVLYIYVYYTYTYTSHCGDFQGYYVFPIYSKMSLTCSRKRFSLFLFFPTLKYPGVCYALSITLLRFVGLVVHDICTLCILISILAIMSEESRVQAKRMPEHVQIQV